jgi:hypothetical protein
MRRFGPLPLLTLLACTGSGSVTLRVSFDPPAVAQEAVVVELALVDECPSEAVWAAAASEPREVLRAARASADPLRFASLKPGSYAVQARAVGADCAVLAATCAPLRVGSSSVVVDVVLKGLPSPTGCGAFGACDLDRVACDCNDDAHLCGDTCVASTVPESCGDRCAPCEAPEHGTALCADEECDFACAFGYEVCATGCCPKVARESLVAAGASLFYPEIVVDSEDRPHVFYPGGASNPGMWHLVRHADGWAETPVDDVSAFTDSIVAVADTTGGVHVFWSPLAPVGQAMRQLKYAVLEGDTVDVDSLGADSSVLAVGIYAGAPWVFRERDSEYSVQVRDADGTWPATPVAFPFPNPIHMSDLFPRFTGPGKLSMFVRDRSDCLPGEGAQSCAVQFLTVDGSAVSAATPTGFHSIAWELYGNSRRQYGGSAGGTLHAMTLESLAPNLTSANVGWLRGDGVDFDYEADVLGVIDRPSMAVNRAGTELWLAYNLEPEPPPDGGIALASGPIRLARRTIATEASEWRVTDIADAVGGAQPLAMAFDFDSKGGAHGVFVTLDSGAPGLGTLGLDYVYIPSGALED